VDNEGKIIEKVTNSHASGFSLIFVY